MLSGTNTEKYDEKPVRVIGVRSELGTEYVTNVSAGVNLFSNIRIIYCEFLQPCCKQSVNKDHHARSGRGYITSID